MNKKYVTPLCDVLSIAKEDILTGSGNADIDRYNEENQLDQAAFDLWN